MTCAINKTVIKSVDMYGEFTYGLYYMNRSDSEPSAKMCGPLTLVAIPCVDVKCLGTVCCNHTQTVVWLFMNICYKFSLL